MATETQSVDSSKNEIAAVKKFEKLPESDRANLLQNNVGRIVEHGKANYNFEKDTTPNYYVKLSDGNKNEKIVWGVDLERAVAEKGSRVGDLVALEKQGKRMVTVDEPVRNEGGEIVSYTKKEAERNAWEVKSPDLSKSAQRELSQKNGEPVRDAKQSPTSDKPQEPQKTFAEQALDALRNAQRAEKNGNSELTAKHNKNAISLAYESGKAGEDISKFKTDTHAELIKSHARGAEAVEIRERAAKFREAEKSVQDQQPQVRIDRRPEVAPTPSEKADKPEKEKTSILAKLSKLTNFAEKQAGDENLEPSKAAKILSQINREFRGVSGSYYKADARGNEHLAFKDTGSRIVTHNNDQKVAFAVAAMAEAKGWSEIRVSGHPDFRRNVWLEAADRGLKVKGYEPNQHDLLALKEREDAKRRESDKQKGGEVEKAGSRNETTSKQGNSSSQRGATPREAGGAIEPVLKAVAEAVVRTQVTNPAAQKMILDRITERQEGKKFAVPTYDMKAPAQPPKVTEKTQTREPTVERTR